MEALALDHSGRPKFLEGEVEITSVHGVSSKFPDGDLTGLIRLTNFRLLIQAKHSNNKNVVANYAVICGNIKTVEAEKSGFFRRYTNMSLTITAQSGELKLHLEFGDNGVREQFREQFLGVMLKKAWESSNRVTKGAFEAKKAGVAGLERSVLEQHGQISSELDQAFKDLRSLMDNAREMTLLANRLTEQGKGQGDEANQLQREMTLLGIGSPVSRDQISDPDVYERELSRQVYDYLMQAHYQADTPLSLIDLYCFYNRARGTDLISPEDLLRAVQLFARLGLHKWSVLHFPSGLYAVVPDTRTQGQDALTGLAQHIVSLIASQGPQTSSQLATHAHMSLALTLTATGHAESLGLLCRDETAQGVVWWQNIFVCT